MSSFFDNVFFNLSKFTKVMLYLATEGVHIYLSTILSFIPREGSWTELWLCCLRHQPFKKKFSHDNNIFFNPTKFFLSQICTHLPLHSFLSSQLSSQSSKLFLHQLGPFTSTGQNASFSGFHVWVTETAAEYRRLFWLRRHYQESTQNSSKKPPL